MLYIILTNNKQHVELIRMFTGQCTASVLQTYLITGEFEPAYVHNCQNARERECYMVDMYVRMYVFVPNYIQLLHYIARIMKTYYASSMASVPNKKVAYCYRN